MLRSSQATLKQRAKTCPWLSISVRFDSKQTDWVKIVTQWPADAVE